MNKCSQILRLKYEDFSVNVFLVFRSIQVGPTSLVINDDGGDNTLDDYDDNDDDDDTWQMRVHQHWGSQLGDIRESSKSSLGL